MSRACSVCTSPLHEEINRHLANRESTRSIERWLAAQNAPIGRNAINRHLEHALDPISQFVENHPPQQIRRTTSTEFLQTVVDVAASKATADNVTVDHGLRAAAELERKSDRGKDGLRILVLALMGDAPDTIEGEYRELPA